MARILFQTRSGSLSDGLKGRLKTPRKAETMKPKSLYRAALLEYLYCASFTADPAEARAAYRTYRRLAKKGCPDGAGSVSAAPGNTATVSSQIPKKPKNITAVPPRQATNMPPNN